VSLTVILNFATNANSPNNVLTVSKLINYKKNNVYQTVMWIIAKTVLHQIYAKLVIKITNSMIKNNVNLFVMLITANIVKFQMIVKYANRTTTKLIANALLFVILKIVIIVKYLIHVINVKMGFL